MSYKRLFLFFFVSIVVFSAMAQEKVEAKSAKEYVFDGFKLGDNYGADVMTRSPYDVPCDNDPIDKKNRRFMVYGALPCRNLVFPEKTTVVFYLKFSESPNEYNQPIEAFAYLYGSYFNGKTDFPLKPGDELKKAREIYGKENPSFEIKRKKWALTVYPFPGNIYVIAIGEKILGFVFGPMPESPDNEQWRGLMQMYARYTPQD